MYCYRCGKDITKHQKTGRQEACPHCGVYLHCCFNCSFYDANVYHQCREPQAEWVKEKDSANYCEYFTHHSKPPQSPSKTDETKKKLDQLFKK